MRLTFVTAPTPSLPQISPRPAGLTLFSRGLFLSVIWVLFGSSSVAAPAFVQSSYAVPQGTTTSPVAVTFPAAQTAGNLNVVVVGWNDASAQVSSVVDSQNNSYQLAVGPTVL